MRLKLWIVPVELANTIIMITYSATSRSWGSSLTGHTLRQSERTFSCKNDKENPLHYAPDFISGSVSTCSPGLPVSPTAPWGPGSPWNPGGPAGPASPLSPAGPWAGAGGRQSGLDGCWERMEVSEKACQMYSQRVQRVPELQPRRPFRGHPVQVEVGF